MRRLLTVLAVLGLQASPAFAGVAPDYDECDAHFIAYIGSNAYQFSPSLPGDLGSVRLFTILSYQRAAAQREFGRAFWRLEIRGPDGTDHLVRQAWGAARIEARGAAVAEFFWDGRDDAGNLVEPGKYHYTFSGRYLRDRLRPGKLIIQYEDLSDFPGIDEAYASTEEVIVDYALDVSTAQAIRESLLMVSCQTQQNGPIESSFPYNFYYGSTHSHSNFSDGGQSTTSCSSGAAYGSGTFAPTDIFNYARNAAGMDYWVVNEHNHLISDAVATSDPPVTEAKVRQRYADGLAAAAAATTTGSFVALYGMEWGVTTNPDQGHVTLIETPLLFGWKNCSVCNGPDPECTPGTDCYFDVFTPKGTYFVNVDTAPLGITDALDLARRLPALVGVAAIPVPVFCHPEGAERTRSLLRFAFCKKTEVLEEAAARLATLRGRL